MQVVLEQGVLVVVGGEVGSPVGVVLLLVGWVGSICVQDVLVMVAGHLGRELVWEVVDVGEQTVSVTVDVQSDVGGTGLVVGGQPGPVKDGVV